MNASRHSLARRSATTRASRWTSSVSTLGDVLAGADHPDGPAVRVVEGAAGAVVQWIDPSAQTMRNSRLYGSPVSRAPPTLARNSSRSSGWIIARYSSKSLGATPGGRPCWMLIWSDQMSAPLATCHSHRPVPEAARTSSSRSSRSRTRAVSRSVSARAAARAPWTSCPRFARLAPGSVVIGAIIAPRSGSPRESKRAARWAARRVHLGW